jgi:hypothetical protein
MAGKDTPQGIILIGILFTLFGLVSICNGFGLAFYRSWAGSYGLYLGAGLLIAGIIELVFGVGFLLGRPWAWKAGVVIFVCSILLQVFSLYTWSRVDASMLDINRNFWSYFGIALTCIMLWYIFLPHVRAYYGKT